jgi:hypothetical protein
VDISGVGKLEKDSITVHPQETKQTHKPNLGGSLPPEKRRHMFYMHL